MAFYLQTGVRKIPPISSFASVDMDGFRKFQIPIPCPNEPSSSLKIQNEIVRILDAFTALTRRPYRRPYRRALPPAKNNTPIIVINCSPLMKITWRGCRWGMLLISKMVKIGSNLVMAISQFMLGRCYVSCRHFCLR